MASSEQPRIWGLGTSPKASTYALALAIVFTLSVATTPAVWAQTYNVIYNFAGGDGNGPTSTLRIVGAGNLYGTTQQGGNGQGVVFKLKHVGSGWVLSPLHDFTGGNGKQDGAYPLDYGGLTVGPDGSLYGTTQLGGVPVGNGLGTVFKLSPPPSACLTALCPWTSTVLYEFTDTPDGSQPYSSVTFDAAGNIYGTTRFGGAAGAGSVFKLTPANGSWTESILTSFGAGASPVAGIIFDGSGNLYGTTPYGGAGSKGQVFQLTPSRSGWTKNIIYAFTGGADGEFPAGGLIFDQAGNLYGSTAAGGSGNGGTIFKLSLSGSTWTLTTLYSFQGGSGGPMSSLTVDAAGNLYGTTYGDGLFGGGSVFTLSAAEGWKFTSLHNFQQDSGGVFPIGGVTLDANGNLFGTASAAGAHNRGVVWEVTP